MRKSFAGIFLTFVSVLACAQAPLPIPNGVPSMVGGTPINSPNQAINNVGCGSVGCCPCGPPPMSTPSNDNSKPSPKNVGQAFIEDQKEKAKK